MATDNFDSEIDDIGISPVEGMLDDAGVFRLQTPNISSSNFDGFISNQQLNIAASAVQPGMQISLTGSVGTQTYYTVLFVDNSDAELSASPSELVTIQYIDEDAFPQILSIGASAIISIQKEDWEEKYIGENGWYIGTSGNAIFSNVAIRGEIEATTMDIGGVDGITYDGNTVTIGASVVINAPLTVGASGNFIVSGSAAQDIISNNTTITGGNIATGTIKSTGYVGPGTGSAFSTTGMSINLDDGSIAAPNFKIDNNGNAHFKGVVQSASGAIGGFSVSASQISIAGFTMSTASGIFLGNNRQFSVDTQGNLIANSASIVGDIRAKSGKVEELIVGSNLYPIVGIQGVNIQSSSVTGNKGQFILSTQILTEGRSKLLYPQDIVSLSGISASGWTYTQGIPTTASSFFVTRNKLKVLSASYDQGIVNKYHCEVVQGGLIIDYNLGSMTANSGSFTFGDMYFGEYQTYSLSAQDTIEGFVFDQVGEGGTWTSHIPDFIDVSGRFRLGGGKLTFDGKDLSVDGNITARSGSFSGVLSAATGTFAGTLSANSITSGTINGSIISVTNLNADNITSGTITGRTFRSSAGINATSGTGIYLDSSGNVRFANGGTSLTIDANKVVIQGSASFSGALSAATGTFAGSLSAATGTFAGSLSAATGTFAGSLSAGVSISSPSITGGTISSTGYSGVTDGSAFSTTGTYLNLTNGAITAKQFRIDASGNAAFGGALSSGISISAPAITGGTISAPTGTIGGFNLGASSLTIGSNPNVVGITSGTNSFFAGATDTAGTGAKFLVTNAGALTATNANITGTINATSGNFSGNITSTATITGGVFRSSSGIDSNSGTGVYLDNAGQVRFATSNGMTFSINSASGFNFSGNTLKILTRSDAGTGNVLYGSINFYTTAGGTIGSISSAASNKTWSGLGDGITLGTNSDYIFLPSAGNSTRPRYLGSGFNWYDANSNLLMSIGGGTGQLQIYRNTTVNSGYTLTTNGITNSANGITNSGGQIQSLPTYNNSDSTITNNMHVTSTGVFRRVSSTQNIKTGIIPINKIILSNLVLKEKISSNAPSIDYRKILTISPVEYSPISEENRDLRVLGFIAEDIADKIPEIATYDLEGNPEYYNLNSIVSAMLAVVQDQQNEINALYDKIIDLESRLG